MKRVRTKKEAADKKQCSSNGGMLSGNCYNHFRTTNLILKTISHGLTDTNLSTGGVFIYPALPFFNSSYLCWLLGKPDLHQTGVQNIALQVCVSCTAYRVMYIHFPLMYILHPISGQAFRQQFTKIYVNK